MKKEILIMSLTIIILIGCSNNLDEVNIEKHKIPVNTVRVEKKLISIPVYTSGILSTKSQIKLSFKTGGIIQKIYKEEGDYVKKGEVLAKLDLSEINAGFQRAKSGYEKTLRDYNRLIKLFNEKVATEEQFQDTKTAYEIAKAQLTAVEFNLNFSTITAPENGKILKRFSEENEITNPGTPVFLYGTTNNDWIIRTGVSDKDILRLGINDNATIIFDSYPNKLFKAKVSELGETSDPFSGTYEVELTIDKPEVKLITGFIGKIKIIPAKRIEAYTVPIEALSEANNNKGIIYKIAKTSSGEEKAEKINISITHVFNNEIAINGNIASLDNIVTNGSPYLRNGSIVNRIP